MPTRPFPKDRLKLAIIAGLTATLLTGCTTTHAPTLYMDLGGRSGLMTIVDRTLDRVASDPRTMRSFEGVKLAAAKEAFFSHLCALSGGNCAYEGETMARAHKGLMITGNEFDGLMAFLREEMTQANVSPAAQAELLALLAPMKRDVVTGSP
jgi:hemoglobin